ncbi:hypothetical protein HORM4_1110009 [Vibrio harveyi]|uniref:hypothetical protein n=1 Tax=Vibrio harveyi TaxID=669 RepID=UPI002ADBBEF7|nr:hypothetical protein [Vibrio harveyi]CAK6712237.1 hypothetical protein HORM4_1110009 [Vibrio harveyi]
MSVQVPNIKQNNKKDLLTMMKAKHINHFHVYRNGFNYLCYYDDENEVFSIVKVNSRLQTVSRTLIKANSISEFLNSGIIFDIEEFKNFYQ